MATTGKVVALIKGLAVTQGSAITATTVSGTTITADTALIVGAATTSGVRIDLESGVLAVREGDDSAYAGLIAGATTLNGGTWGFGTSCYARGRIYLGTTGLEDVGLFRASTNALSIETDPRGNATNIHQVHTASTALTSGATYTFTGALPAGAIILGVSARITTTITGPTSVQIGDGTDADRYGVFSTLTAGQTINHTGATASPLEWRSAAGNVVLTAVGGNFTAGAVRISVHYITLTAPTS